MENDLHQAFYGVFCSSKEIIKNNQRHLFINMLDLLGRTCKATGLAKDKIGVDNLVEFWLSDILPLLFDQDSAIQTCAVTAFEQGLRLLEPSQIHQSRIWPDLRNSIIAEIPEKIQNLRETKNKHWRIIWCFIITILDREILKGASVINSFLSIVELGFRSSDSNVRAEAFTCWRLLIKIFSKYNELLTPKRLKLICIPLKSSQSKSHHSSNVRVRVWWYFITCIQEKLDVHFNNAVEPFLSLLFGSTTKDTAGIVQQYPALQTISVLCLAQLILEDQDKYISRLMDEHNLEILNQPSLIMSQKILKEHYSTIINATLSAIRILCNTDENAEDFEVNQYLLNYFVLRLVSIMLRLNYAPCSQTICDGLIKFLPAQTLPLKTALNYIASTGFSAEMPTSNEENLLGVLNPLISLFIAGKHFITQTILQDCVEQFVKIGQTFNDENVQWKLLSVLIKTITNSKEDDDYEAFEVRLTCWRHLSRITLTYIQENSLNYRRKEFAEILNRFVFWPLKQFASFTGNSQRVCFDDDFCALWRQLLLSGQNAPERNQFLQEIKNVLQELSNKNNKDDFLLTEFVDAYVAATMKLNFSKDSTYIAKVFTFLDELLGRPQISTSKAFEQYLNTFRNFLLHLKNQELTNNFDIIKSVIAHIASNVSKEKCINQKFFDEWKQGIIERFRMQPQKTLTSQIREVFKGSDVFVIIPTVWMLNPEKLTERQKERFAERSDIPALYNDMSQSQDSSIKPWTPNKIVIAKKDQTEIIIGSSDVGVTEKDNDNLNNKIETEDFLQGEKRNLRKITTKCNEKLEDNMKLRSLRSSANATENEAKRNTVHEESLTIGIPAKRGRKSLKNKIDDLNRKTEETTLQNMDFNTVTIAKETEINEKQDEPLETTSLNENQSDAPVNDALQEKQVCSRDTQINTEEKSSNPNTELQTEKSNPKTQNENKTLSEGNDRELDNQTDKCTAANIDSMQMNLDAKEISPKKTIPKIVTLSSPPDRKSTNNSCSPSLRPKPTPHLTRGAQLINMIRSKMKVDGSSSYSTSPGLPRSSIQLTKSDKRDCTPVSDIFDNIANENTTTTQKDLLTFTKRLPSPSASPSVSILKRKLRRESFDETPTESPASKRKRVSFHDPPVSTTKEYVKDAEENHVKPKRCLALDRAGISPTAEIKHALKRQSKLDSMVEIDNCGDDHYNINHISPLPQTKLSQDTANYEDKNIIDLSSEQLTPSPLENIAGEKPLDKESALKTVVQECSLESVLESYILNDSTALVKSVDTLAKFMSKCMTTNSKVKASILEILSENHSKDFLDHAIQENLSSVVCDRLNVNSIIEYICAMSKLNSSCRHNLLLEIPEIIKHSKLDTEPMNFITTVIESLNLGDNHILDLISALMQIRNNRRTLLTSEIESTDVSSSNL